MKTLVGTKTQRALCACGNLAPLIIVKVFEKDIVKARCEKCGEILTLKYKKTT